MLLYSSRSYKKTHHSDALLHRYFDEVWPQKPYSIRKLVLTISLVLLCVLPLFFAGAFFVYRAQLGLFKLTRAGNCRYKSDWVKTITSIQPLKNPSKRVHFFSCFSFNFKSGRSMTSCDDLVLYLSSYIATAFCAESRRLIILSP